MRIGVVSDTHNNLRNVGKIIELLNAAKVDRVIHTGDITQAKTLNLFAQLDAPLFGVFGNNDLERESLESSIAIHGFSFCEPPFITTWADKEIIVVHDPLEFAGRLTNQALALHGHTHRYRHEQTGQQLIFNPGECAGIIAGFNSIGIVDLTNMQTQQIKF